MFGSHLVEPYVGELWIATTADTMMKDAMEQQQAMDMENMTEEDLKKFIEGVIEDMVSAGEIEAGHEGEGEENEEDKEEMDLDEILFELKSFKPVKDQSPKSKNAIFHKDKDEYVTDQSEEDDEPYSKEKASKISFSKIKELQDELTETYEAVNTLRSELNEINLLNAKLLYTNKIFKSMLRDFSPINR
jgi:hypothetical protein